MSGEVCVERGVQIMELSELGKSARGTVTLVMVQKCQLPGVGGWWIDSMSWCKKVAVNNDLWTTGKMHRTGNTATMNSCWLFALLLTGPFAIQTGALQHQCLEDISAPSRERVWDNWLEMEDEKESTRRPMSRTIQTPRGDTGDGRTINIRLALVYTVVVCNLGSEMPAFVED